MNGAIPEPLVTLDELRRLRGYSKATGEIGERVKVTVRDISRAHPDSRGRTFEGTVQTVTPSEGVRFDSDAVKDVRSWILIVQADEDEDNRPIMYAFNTWLIERIERLDA